MLKQGIYILALMLSTVISSPAATGPDVSHFCNIQRMPDAVSAITETGSQVLNSERTEVWMGGGLKVRFHEQRSGLTVELTAPEAAVKSLEIRWNGKLPGDWKYLGDAWERAYGDLEWKPLDAKRVMPWYFLASDGKMTHGYGVMTGPGGLCYWTVDEQGITLHADVRCGGKGVQLGKRSLKVCTVASRRGLGDETPFAAAQAFCRAMCPKPRMPRQPVYGFNDWYCTYGHDTADSFLTNVAYVSALSPDKANRPFAVADDGWQWLGNNGVSPGLWNEVRPEFSTTLTMADLARRVEELGARPGLWYRPLLANADQPPGWRLQRDLSILDPTIPEVRAEIRKCMARFHKWGYEMVKHDYTTYDICGRWGMKMGADVTPDGWAFADRSRTTAEVIRGLYQDIREAAGDRTLIIGCNTMGHLAAGIFELQRIGDDTSGNDWNRTRQMGVNCLAFRAPQNGTFFMVDADCAGQTSAGSVSWAKNSQWLNLLAHSGTALFVSFPRETISAEQERAIGEALKISSRPQPLGEALDWQSRRAPEAWRFGAAETHFSW